MLALCAAARIRADGPWAQPSITLVAVFAAVVLSPATAYLYLAHPDWSWLYLLDASRVPRLFVVPAVAAQAGALIGGYYAAGRLIGAGRRIAAILLGAGLVAAVSAVLARGRLLRYGTYRDFQGGRTVSLFEVKLGFVLIAVLVGVAAAIGYLGWELWRDGRRATAR